MRSCSCVARAVAARASSFTRLSNHAPLAQCQRTHRIVQASVYDTCSRHQHKVGPPIKPADTRPVTSPPCKRLSTADSQRTKRQQRKQGVGKRGARRKESKTMLRKMAQKGLKTPCCVRTHFGAKPALFCGAQAGTDPPCPSRSWAPSQPVN